MKAFRELLEKDIQQNAMHVFVGIHLKNKNNHKKNSPPIVRVIGILMKVNKKMLIQLRGEQHFYVNYI